MPDGNPSTLSSSGGAADQQFSQQPASQPAAPCKKDWIAIELLDAEGNAVPGESYRLQLPDGSIREGALDSKGTATVSGIEPGTCKVCFPRIDGRVWRDM